MSSPGRPARFCVRAWRNRTDRTQEVEQTYPKIAFDCMISRGEGSATCRRPSSVSPAPSAASSGAYETREHPRDRGRVSRQRANQIAAKKDLVPEAVGLQLEVKAHADPASPAAPQRRSAGGSGGSRSATESR
jgi:hypothetical protein